MAQTELGDGEDRSGAAGESHRPYIGVYFECCGVYQRIYRHPEQEVYLGRCPRCLRVVRVRVGPQGTSERMFRAR